MRLLVTFLFFNIFHNSLIANDLKDTLVVAYTRAAPFIITDNGQPKGDKYMALGQNSNKLGDRIPIGRNGF